MTNPIVFIVGCPRSGTTLLRHIVSGVVVQEHAATVRTTLTTKFPDLFSPLENK